MKIGMIDTLMLLAGKGVPKELTNFGEKNKNGEMVAQAAQLEINGRLLDAAVLSSTIFCVLSCVYSDDATRYTICATLTGGSATFLLYVSKKIYDNACYVQKALNKHPSLLRRMIIRNL